MLATNCCETRVSVLGSMIQHAGTRNGVFAGRNFEGKGVAELYSGSLAYMDLGRELRSKKKNREVYMEAMVKSFRKETLELEEKISDSRSQEHSVWVAPAALYIMRYTHVRLYL